MPIPHEILMELWYQALEEPVGIIVSTTDRDYLKQHLWIARKQSGDDRLKVLSVMLPGKLDELWIVRRDADAAEKGNFELVRRRY